MSLTQNEKTQLDALVENLCKIVKENWQKGTKRYEVPYDPTKGQITDYFNTLTEMEKAILALWVLQAPPKSVCYDLAPHSATKSSATKSHGYGLYYTNTRNTRYIYYHPKSNSVADLNNKSANYKKFWEKEHGKQSNGNKV